jgi:hypothetical protein
MNTKTFFILLISAVNLTYCQTPNYDKRIVEEIASVGVLEAPFMVNELIEIYKKDTLVIKKTFNKEIFERTEYTRYCYDVCSDFFL